jgi:hypothetical protein
MSAFAATIGGNPGPVQLVASPPTFNTCELPISTMSDLTVDSQGADFSLSNTSSTKSQDALVIDLYVQGEHRLYWVPVVLRPGQGVAVHATFLVPVETPIIILCKNHPVGIVEHPDPVVAVDAQAPAGP